MKFEEGKLYKIKCFNSYLNMKMIKNWKEHRIQRAEKVLDSNLVQFSYDTKPHYYEPEDFTEIKSLF